MDLYAELKDRKNYAAVFADLREKAREAPYRLSSRPVRKAISLEWILAEESLVTGRLLRAIRRRKYLPQEGRRNEIQLDKKRRIYALCWPDKIVEAVMARALAAAVEGQLSQRLFSYRKGRSNLLAVQSLAEYFKLNAARGVPVFVIKRDVDHFGESIRVGTLLEKIQAVIGEQDPYADTLLRSFLRPRFRDSAGDEILTLKQGLPDGFAITTVCENLYLTEVDKAMEVESDALYCRYGDDIMLAHTSPQRALHLAEVLQNRVGRLGLEFKKEKMKNVCLTAGPAKAESPFVLGRSLDYLGFNISAGGEIFLSRNKLRALQSQLRRIARYSFYANRRSCSGDDGVIDAVINSLNLHLAEELREPYLTLALVCVNNIDKLKSLDKWIAKLPLRFIHGTGHDRVFRYESLSGIRSRGLVSLVHLRNLAQRGLR